MEIFSGRRGDWTILSLRGRLDALSSPQAREEILAVIERGDRQLLFDCTGLDYVSSAGLRVLFEVADRMQECSGQLACYAVSANVRRVFVLADLGADIRICDTLEQALAG